MTEKFMKCLIFSTAAVLLFLTTGCYDNYDLEDRQLCTAIAADYSDEKGFEIILSLPRLEKEDETGRVLKTHSGKHLNQVIEEIDGASSKGLYFGHTRTAILGLGLLKNEAALSELISYLSENVQIDKNIILVASEDPAKLMDAEPEEDKLTGFFISGFYEGGKDKSTFVNKENLISYLKDQSENKCAVIPLMTVEEETPTFNGLAILKGEKLGGTLTREESFGYMWLSDRDFAGAFAPSSLPISAEIVDKQTNYGFIQEGNKIHTTITVDVSGNMWSYTDDEIKAKGADYINAFEAEIKSQAEKAISRLKEINCDALRLKELIKKKNRRLTDMGLTGPDYDNIETDINFTLNLV